MGPKIATVACLAFIAYLFWNDIKKRKGTSISWVPLAWMFLAGSRYVSSWLYLGAPISSVDDYAEGSPVDRAVFFALILAGMFVLSRRHIDWGRLLTRNKWIVLYFLYCLSSILWTDEPFVLVKRWSKDLGNPIMALVILTELQPYEAIGITFRRLSFLLLPLSVLFIRYYPELGRTYHADGSPLYTGIGHQKNDLGLMCLATGIYFSWKILQSRKGGASAERPDVHDALLIGMLVWLLHMSDSQTSVACLVVSIALLLLARMPVVSAKTSRVVAITAVVGVSYFALDSTFHIKDSLLALLGRDATLTDRTDLWDVVRSHAVNPIIGAGFMSFWTGARMQAIWDVLGSGINQAHNGYLEQYVNLGYVGVGFIVVILLSGLYKVRKELDVNPAAGLLRLCFLVSAVLYNYTEASFYGINNMWLMLLLGCLDTSDARPEREETRAIGLPRPAVHLPSQRQAASAMPLNRRPTVAPRRLAR